MSELFAFCSLDVEANMGSGVISLENIRIKVNGGSNLTTKDFVKGNGKIRG